MRYSKRRGQLAKIKPFGLMNAKLVQIEDLQE